MLDELVALNFPYGSPSDYEDNVLGEDEYFVVGDNRYNSHGVQSFIQFLTLTSKSKLLTSVPIPLQPVLSQQYLITSQAIREGKS